jgi:hypothetical protein
MTVYPESATSTSAAVFSPQFMVTRRADASP